MQKRALAGSIIEYLDARLCLANVAPTAQEQYFIELLNRARANPPQYAIDFNLAVPLTDASPRPPLAVNGFLTDSSRGHAVEMATFNYFAHTSTVTGKAPNRMARDAGYVLPSFYPDDQNYIESLAAGSAASYQSAQAPLDALLVDEGLNPPGHRIHLLAMDPFYETHNEIGVGYGFSNSSQYKNYWAIHTGPDSAERTFLTGVVYSDTITANNFYTPGEGKGSVNIVATRVGDGQQFSTTSYSSGGYSLPLTAGTYNVTASGGELAAPVTINNITIGTTNVKRDFVASAVPIGPSVISSSYLFDVSETRIEFVFSESVQKSLGFEDIEVFNVTTNQPVFVSGLTYFPGSNSSRFSLQTPLTDANYRATIIASGVTNSAGAMLLENATLDFYVLAADANRDRSVNLDDFTILAANFGQTNRVFSQGNFNYSNDGAVNLDDFTILASQFGKSVPAPTDLPRQSPARPMAEPRVELFSREFVSVLSSPLQSNRNDTDVLAELLR